MMDSTAERLRLLESILDHMNVAVTYTNSEGIILYCNPIAVQRPTKTPRKVGMNIRDCHKEETDKKVSRIFGDFVNGRREPHHYISKLTGKKELVTLIPFFEEDVFVGCMSQIHLLEVEGEKRSFT